MLACFLETSALVGWIILINIFKVCKQLNSDKLNYLRSGFTAYLYRWRNEGKKIKLLPISTECL